MSTFKNWLKMWYMPKRDFVWFCIHVTIAMNCLVCAAIMIDFTVNDFVRHYYGLMFFVWGFFAQPFFWGVITQESCDRWCKKKAVQA